MLGLSITAIKHAARRAGAALENVTAAKKIAPILKNVASALEGENVDILKTERLAKSIESATFAFYIGLGVFVALMIVLLFVLLRKPHLKHQ